MAPRSEGQLMDAGGEDDGLARRGSVSASTVVAIWAARSSSSASVPCCGSGSTSVARVLVAAIRSSRAGVVAVDWKGEVAVARGPRVAGAMPWMVVRGRPVGGEDVDGRGGPSGDGRDSGARTAGAVARFSVVSSRPALWCIRLRLRRLAANENASLGLAAGSFARAAMRSVSSSLGTGTNCDTRGGGLFMWAEPMRLASPSSSNGPCPAMIS